MPVSLQGDLLISAEEAEGLWRAVRQARDFDDVDVTVRTVDEEESRRLKREYKGIDEATNVLSFSYPDSSDHDIALCLSIVEREAREQEFDLKDYLAWLLAHAFLHVTGMDHERSEEEAEEQKKLERDILGQLGLGRIY